jgi:hypothetical protein
MNSKQEHFEKMILELREECSDFRDVDFLVKLCRRYALLSQKRREDILNNHLSVFSKSYKDNLDYLNELFNIEKKVALAKTAVSILECPFTDEDNLNEIHNLSSLCEIVAEMRHHKDKEYL